MLLCHQINRTPPPYLIFTYFNLILILKIFSFFIFYKILTLFSILLSKFHSFHLRKWNPKSYLLKIFDKKGLIWKFNKYHNFNVDLVKDIIISLRLKDAKNIKSLVTLIQSLFYEQNSQEQTQTSWSQRDFQLLDQ